MFASLTFLRGFGAGFLEAVLQDRFGMLDCPTIWQHRFELAVLGVQTDEKVAHVNPWLDAMSLRTGKDRVQHCGTRATVRTAQEQPVLPSDRLMSQRAFGCVVVDRVLSKN